ncbi:MAG: non-canonical purine NTP pyrophosphatase [Bacteroidia bacterium]|nr:non-canonical purine NTP pyrophosphatase [Bacteroidia bacterium]
MEERIILLVTQNQHKVQEISTMLSEFISVPTPAYHVISLKSLSRAPVIVERGLTFKENSFSKNASLLSWFYSGGMEEFLKVFPSGMGHLLSDDSGLEVDALGGAPGVYSARFAALESGMQGNSTDSSNNAKLLRDLEQVPLQERSARFHCVLSLTEVDVNADMEDLLERTEFFEGVCEGRIASEPRGKNGFGYDPLFIPENYHVSFAELGDTVKNSISHRSKALRSFVQFFAQLAKS